MNSKGQNKSFIFIIAVIVLAVFIIIGLGELQISPLTDEDPPEKYCSNELQTFEIEYGVAEKGTAIWLNEINFYIFEFENGWHVPVDGSDCRIVENSNSSFLRFQIWDFDKRLQSFKENFYEITVNCPQNKFAKGGSEACKITTPINDALDAPVTDFLVALPTESAEKLADILFEKGYTTKYVVGKTLGLVKFVKGSSFIIATLEVTETAGCALGNTPQRAVFDLAEFGKQFFHDMRRHQYLSNSISDLAIINDQIITFNSLDSLLGLLGSVLNQQCGNSEQIKQYQQFQDLLTPNYESATSLNNSFQTELKRLQDEAIAAMSAETKTREENAPKGDQWILILKAVEYHFTKSDSKKLFDDQLFLSSKKSAENQTESYEEYWDNIGIVDWILSLLVWIVLFVIIFSIVYFVYVFLKRFN